MSEDVHQQSRRRDRVERVQTLFAWNFQGESTAPSQDEQFLSIQEIIPVVQRIDSFILHYAPKHTITEFNKMDLAILRQALYELLYTSTPALVVINEAIEIAKEFGSDQSSRFVNGVLGAFWDERQKGTHATNTESTDSATEQQPKNH